MTRDEIRAALTDAVALRCTLEGEVRGEPLIGQIGVACVISNRLKHGRFGRSLTAVCLGKSQFSCWWGKDANTEHTYRLAETLISDPGVDPDHQLAWVTAGLLTQAIVDDPTKGADHYLTTDLYRHHPPTWVKGQPILATLGQHVFLRVS